MALSVGGKDETAALGDALLVHNAVAFRRLLLRLKAISVAEDSGSPPGVGESCQGIRAIEHVLASKRTRRASILRP